MELEKKEYTNKRKTTKRNVNKGIADFYAQNGYIPNNSELGEYLGITRQTVAEYRKDSPKLTNLTEFDPIIRETFAKTLLSCYNSCSVHELLKLIEVYEKLNGEIHKEAGEEDGYTGITMIYKTNVEQQVTHEVPEVDFGHNYEDMKDELEAEREGRLPKTNNRKNDYRKHPDYDGRFDKQYLYLDYAKALQVVEDMKDRIDRMIKAEKEHNRIINED